MYVLLLGMAFLLASQINPANPQTSVSPQEKCTISGTVFSAADGQPLRDAVISLREAGSVGSSTSVVTDAGGHFEAKEVTPGRYFLTASHAGYVSMQYGQKTPDEPGRMLELRPGQAVRDISFKLIRGAVISGHVYSEDGEPVERVQVRAERYGFFQGKRRLMPTGFAQTDDRGKYRIFDLPPGKYYISATGSPIQYSGSLSYEPTFYPGVVDVSQASPATVQAGNEFPDVDFTIQRVRTFHLRGRVTGAAVGPAVTRAILYVEVNTGPLGNFGFGGNVKDAQGDFDISGVRPGTYDLIARLSYRGYTYQARQPVTVVDSDVDGIQLVLTPGATLQGVIQTEGSVDLSKVRVFLNPPNGVMFGSSGNAAVSPDGSLEFDSIPDGHYLVRIFGLPQNAYVKSATLGNEDVLDKGFDISNGQSPGNSLKIVVGANGGQISGTVMLDGKPFTSALVTLLPADSARLSNDLWFKSAATDQYGNFTLSGIRPGDYRLFAWEKNTEGEERDPAFISQFKDQGQEVQVGPGAMLNFQLSAISAAKIQAAEGQ
jgi:protocatechuate 3,4-dioxygenase beta subunit